MKMSKKKKVSKTFTRKDKTLEKIFIVKINQKKKNK